MFNFPVLRVSQVCALLIATSFLLGGCDGKRSIAGPNPADPAPTRAKVTVDQEEGGIQRTEVVFVFPVPGDRLEFNSDTVLTYSRVEEGRVSPLLFTGDNPSGNYTARAFLDGEEIGTWVIPTEPGYKVSVKLAIGKDAVVEKKHAISPLPPIPDTDSAVSLGSDG